LREGGHLEDKGIHRRIILKYIFKNWDGDMDWIDPVSDRGCCKCGNEPSESIKCG
jgi:hypothetical protein